MVMEQGGVGPDVHLVHMGLRMWLRFGLTLGSPGATVHMAIETLVRSVPPA